MVSITDRSLKWKGKSEEKVKVMRCEKDFKDGGRGQRIWVVFGSWKWQENRFSSGATEKELDLTESLILAQ